MSSRTSATAASAPTRKPRPGCTASATSSPARRQLRSCGSTKGSSARKLPAAHFGERIADDLLEGPWVQRLRYEPVASRFQRAVLVVAVAPGERDDVGLL